MRIGIPRESKEGERRVGLTPAEAAALVADGHDVRVEAGAGTGIGAPDEAYRAVGAVVGTRDNAWDSTLVVKVKEVQPAELARACRGSTLFGFQHLVGEPEMARGLAARGASAIAYELVRDGDGDFPLLAPMSEIAGRMALEVAERLLGNAPQRVLVLGAGHAGLAAAKAACAAGSRVAILTRSARSRDAARAKLGEAACELASPEAIEREALVADLVVGAVFLPGTPTPKLLPRALVARMRRGSVLVDISIDAGGVAQTSRPTTHADPIYVEEGVIHYCVGNMPSADPVASAAALAGAALPYVRALAGLGVERAIARDACLRGAVLLWKGAVVHAGIASETGLPYTPLLVPATP